MRRLTRWVGVVIGTATVMVGVVAVIVTAPIVAVLGKRKEGSDA